MPGKDPGGFFVTILLGLAGSLVGFFVFTELLGIGDTEMFDLGGLIGAIIGTMILLGGLPRRRGRATRVRPRTATPLATLYPCARERARLRPAVPLPALRRRAARGAGGGERRRGGREAARPVRPRHGRRRRRGAGRGRAARRAGRARHRDLGGGRRSTRTCTCSATASTTAAGARRAPAGRPRRPRAPRRRHGRAPGRAGLRGRPGADRRRARPPASRSGGRTWPPPCWPTRPTPSGSRAEGHADVSSFIPAYLIQGKPGYVARTHPTVEEAIALDPRGRPAWRSGRTRSGTSRTTPRCSPRSTATATPGSTAWRSSTRPTRRAAGARCWPTAARELGLLDHRLVGLPRPRPPPVQPLPGLRPPGPRAQPRPDRVRRRSPPPRAAWTGCACGSPACRARASPPSAALAAGQLRELGPPRGGARRGRRAPEPVLRPRLLARGPRQNVRRLAWVADLLSRNGVITFVAADVALPASRATPPARAWASASWRSTCGRRWRSASAAT